MNRERHFRAMGTDAHVLVVPREHDHAAVDALLERAVARIDELERRWSRFMPGSEVCELTRRSGTTVAVSADTRLLVERATEAYRRSGASFDPTVLGDLIRAGYDRSFEHLGTNPPAGLSALMTGCDDIEITPAGVRLPKGTGFDPGGIGKGLAADIVTHELLEAGAAGACVNLGGDVRVRGDGPTATGTDGGPWTVAIEYPGLAEPLRLVGLTDGAVATSTTLRRAWRRDGVEHHHLIDPATGEPTTSDLNLTAVVASQGWLAEILAKAVLLRGSAHPFDLIGDGVAEALAVDNAGRVQCSAGFHLFTGGAPRPMTSARPRSPVASPARFAPDDHGCRARTGGAPRRKAPAREKLR